MTYNFKYSVRTLQYIIGSLYKHNDISYWYCIAPQLAFYPEMLWAHSSETFEANTQSSYLSKISHIIIGEKNFHVENYSFLYRIWTIYGVFVPNLCGKNLCEENLCREKKMMKNMRSANTYSGYEFLLRIGAHMLYRHMGQFLLLLLFLKVEPPCDQTWWDSLIFSILSCFSYVLHAENTLVGPVGPF